MKILNIDAFAEVKRQVSFGGVSYPVQSPSVQQFINSLKASELLEAGKADGLTAARSFEQAVDSVAEAIPTMPREMIQALKLPAMTAVLDFIRGDSDDKASDEKDEAAPGVEAVAEKKPT